jgi:hypothetical protein
VGKPHEADPPTIMRRVLPWTGIFSFAYLPSNITCVHLPIHGCREV